MNDREIKALIKWNANMAESCGDIHGLRRIKAGHKSTADALAYLRSRVEKLAAEVEDLNRLSTTYFGVRDAAR